MTPHIIKSERYTTYVVGLYDLYHAIINKMILDKVNRYIHIYFLKELFDKEYYSVSQSSYIKEYMKEINNDFDSHGGQILIDIRNEDDNTVALEVLK